MFGFGKGGHTGRDDDARGGDRDDWRDDDAARDGDRGNRRGDDGIRGGDHGDRRGDDDAEGVARDDWRDDAAVKGDDRGVRDDAAGDGDRGVCDDRDDGDRSDRDDGDSGDVAADDDERFERAWDSGRGGRERWVVEPGGSKVIDIDALDAARLSLVAGRVDVIGHDGPDARLEITNVRGERVRVLLDGGRLAVRHADAGGRPRVMRLFSGTNTVSADVSLLVPRGIALKVDCVSGDTLVSGLTRGADLNTVSGTVLANGLSGRLRLDTVSGGVEARDHHGSIRSNTVSGDVTISGDCTEIVADSVSGDLVVDAFGRPSSIRVTAVSGGAMLRLDPQVHARYHVDAMHGKVRIDGRRFRTGLGGALDYEDGPADEPVTAVTMSAVSGSLLVMHRADDAPAPDDAGDACPPDRSDGPESDGER